MPKVLTWCISAKSTSLSKSFGRVSHAIPYKTSQPIVHISGFRKHLWIIPSKTHWSPRMIKSFVSRLSYTFFHTEDPSGQITIKFHQPTKPPFVGVLRSCEVAIVFIIPKLMRSFHHTWSSTKKNIAWAKCRRGKPPKENDTNWQSATKSGHTQLSSYIKISSMLDEQRWKPWNDIPLYCLVNRELIMAYYNPYITG